MQMQQLLINFEHATRSINILDSINMTIEDTIAELIPGATYKEAKIDDNAVDFAGASKKWLDMYKEQSIDLGRTPIVLITVSWPFLLANTMGHEDDDEADSTAVYGDGVEEGELADAGSSQKTFTVKKEKSEAFVDGKFHVGAYKEGARMEFGYVGRIDPTTKGDRWVVYLPFVSEEPFIGQHNAKMKIAYAKWKESSRAARTMDVTTKVTKAKRKLQAKTSFRNTMPRVGASS